MTQDGGSNRSHPILPFQFNNGHVDNGGEDVTTTEVDIIQEGFGGPVQAEVSSERLVGAGRPAGVVHNDSSGDGDRSDRAAGSALGEPDPVTQVFIAEAWKIHQAVARIQELLIDLQVENARLREKARLWGKL